MTLKDKIIEAKNILGRKAAFIIAEDLGLDLKDGNVLKALCPFHNEKTPSFIWNDKENYFKCFGCGRVYGILDHYQSLGLSYRQAVDKLFKETGIDDIVEFKYKNEEFFKNYRYPKEETNTNRDIVEKYLASRKISVKTLDYAGIKQDKRGNIVFEHRDENGRLLAVKYRPARKLKKGETKMWWQEGASTCHILYGIDKIDITQPLLIVEGHIDRLACIEAGFTNVVSVPMGANSYEWIEFNWDWLENFDKIIIWADNDEAGEKMIKEVVPRLGEYRTYIVDIPNDVIEKIEQEFKTTKADANNVLYVCGKQAVLDIINNAKEVPISDVKDLMKCEDYDILSVEKISTGFNALDEMIFAHVMGSFNIWTGYTGEGKSTLVYQSCVLEPLEAGYKVFIFSGELMNSQTKNWIQIPLAGERHIIEIDNGKFKPKTYKVTKEAQEKIEKYYENKIFLYDNFLNCKPTDVLNKMKDMYKRGGVKVFIIDNLMCIDFDDSDDKWDAQKRFIMELIKFTMKYKVITHLIAHPKKPNGFAPLTEYDIFGSSNTPNLAHRIFSIRRVSQKEKQGYMNKNGEYTQEPIKYDAILTVLKDRITGVKKYDIGLYFDKKTKRFYGDNDNLHRIYKWDDGSIKYDEKTRKRLVVNNREEDEVLGRID